MKKGWNTCYGNGIAGVLFWSDGSTCWVLFWELGGNYVLSMLKLLMPSTSSDCWEILLLHGGFTRVCIGELEIARSLLLWNRKPMRSLLLCLWSSQVGIVRRLTTDASVYKICRVMWIAAVVGLLNHMRVNRCRVSCVRNCMLTWISERLQPLHLHISFPASSDNPSPPQPLPASPCMATLNPPSSPVDNLCRPI